MSRRYKLSDPALSALDDRLFNYRVIERLIARRKYELENDRKASDNVGGGKSSKRSGPVEDIVIKWTKTVT